MTAISPLVAFAPGIIPILSSQTVTTFLQTETGFLTGNQRPVAGSLMQIDNLLESTPSAFALQTEGGIWSSSAYTFVGFSKEFTPSTVSGQGFSGPLTTLFAFANNNNATAPVVAFIADAVARTANSTVFGANIIARNATVNGTKLVGLEIDVEPAVGTTISSNSIGLALNVFSLGTTDPTPAIQLGGVGGGTWANGYLSSHVQHYHFAIVSGDPTTSLGFINTTNGTFSLAAIVLGTGASQAIAFGGTSFGTNPYLYADSGNDLLVNMGSSGFIIFQEPGGAQRFTFDKFGVLNMPNNGAIKINTTQVLGAQITGYGTPTGGSYQASFAAGSITLANLAAAVAQLIVDLKTHGMIGA